MSFSLLTRPCDSFRFWRYTGIDIGVLNFIYVLWCLGITLNQSLESLLSSKKSSVTLAQARSWLVGSYEVLPLYLVTVSFRFIYNTAEIRCPSFDSWGAPFEERKKVTKFTWLFLASTRCYLLRPKSHCNRLKRTLGLFLFLAEMRSLWPW